MDIDNILVELEIIGQLKEHDKLAISVIPGDTKIFVSTYSWYSRIVRKYNGYGRDTCIKHIEILVDMVEKTSKTIIEGSLSDMCVTIKSSIAKCNTGLKNLKDTYQDDSEIVAKLVILINRMEKILKLLEEFNDSINIDINSSINLNIPDNEEAYTRNMTVTHTSPKHGNNNNDNNDNNNNNYNNDNNDNNGSSSPDGYNTITGAITRTRDQATINKTTTNLMESNLKNFASSTKKKMLS